MSDDELKVVVTTALKMLLSSRKVNTPATSLELLTSVMTCKMPSGLLANAPTPKFRLTDLAHFEHIVENLSNTWTDGVITCSRDESSGRMMIWDVSSHLSSSGGRPLLGSSSSNSLRITELPGLSSRKRKRVVDEDADSAAGDDETLLEEEVMSGSTSSLAELSADMREAYMILQKSTAKGRLLAEQV
jgi:mRNA (2'-O-methyladenosine-N6-)-methyltransferase